MSSLIILLSLLGAPAEAPEAQLNLCHQLGTVSKQILQFAGHLEKEDRALQDHLIETSARLATHCLDSQKLSARKIEQEVQSINLIIQAMDQMRSPF